MTKTVTVLIAILISATLFGQSFEGEIVYNNKFKSRIPNVSDQQLTLMMGSKQEYFIKNGDYKSVSDGSLIQWQLYINSDNKLYNKMANSATIFWNDGSENKDEVLTTEINYGVVDILGYKCDEIILTCKSGTQKYYFTSKLPVDVELFEKHKYGNWSEFILKSKALPVKLIVETPQFTLEGVAISVLPMTLEKSFFQLPPDLKTAKSPY